MNQFNYDTDMKLKLSQRLKTEDPAQSFVVLCVL